MQLNLPNSYMWFSAAGETWGALFWKQRNLLYSTEGKSLQGLCLHVWQGCTSRRGVAEQCAVRVPPRDTGRALTVQCTEVWGWNVRITHLNQNSTSPVRLYHTAKGRRLSVTRWKDNFKRQERAPVSLLRSGASRLERSICSLLIQGV